MGSWIDFWNQPNAIYVNERNLIAHFDVIKRDLLAFMPPSGGKYVLDFGCGDALGAPALAEGCNTLYLYDAAPAVVTRLRGRYERDRRIRVVDDNGLRRIPTGSLDLIVVVSVIQYISQAELAELMALWHRLLRSGGQLIVADVIEPDTPLYRDVLSQLRFARRNGFLIPALIGLGRMFFSDYRTLRRDAGFSTYQPIEMLRMLYEAGFEAAPLPGNIGPVSHRCSFVGRKLTNQSRVAAQ